MEPHLSALVFHEWEPGRPGGELVERRLSALRILPFTDFDRLSNKATSIYPSGPHAMTISVAGDEAVDAVFDIAASSTNTLILTLRDNCPSISTANREVVSFPDYSCRAYRNGSTICAPIGPGLWAWSETSKTYHGLVFAPLERLFALPSKLLLLQGDNWKSSGRGDFPVLVGSGHAPVIGIVENTLSAIEAREDRACASGSRLHLVTRALPSTVELSAQPLNCEWRQIMMITYGGELVYGTFPVKWVGPWADGPLFTVVSLTEGLYHEAGKPEAQWEGDPSTEHVAWQGDFGTIRMRDGAFCPAIGTDGVPTPVAIAAGAAWYGSPECLPPTVPSTAVFEGCPLLAHAGSATIVNTLLATGADPNTKCVNASTTLSRVMQRPYWLIIGENDTRDAVSALLDAGAGVCAWPRGPLGPIGWTGSDISVDEYSDDIFRRYEYEDFDALELVQRAAPTAPCEPGFHLLPGADCDGLTICPIGHYCPGWNARTNSAWPCPAGTYGQRPGMSSAS